MGFSDGVGINVYALLLRFFGHLPREEILEVILIGSH